MTSRQPFFRLTLLIPFHGDISEEAIHVTKLLCVTAKYWWTSILCVAPHLELLFHLIFNYSNQYILPVIF